MTDPITPHRRTSLTVLIIVGALYWFAAALVVRWTAAGWVGSTVATMFVFALIVIVTIPALFLGMRLAGSGRSGACHASMVMTMSALLLDGIALTWFPGLYGSDPKVVLGGAAAIMFGAGIALAIGMAVQRG